jgi:hypothetical protein
MLKGMKKGMKIGWKDGEGVNRSGKARLESWFV